MFVHCEQAKWESNCPLRANLENKQLQILHLKIELRTSWEKQNSSSQSLIPPQFALNVWLMYLWCNILWFSLLSSVIIQCFLLHFLSFSSVWHPVTLTLVTSIKRLLSTCPHDMRWFFLHFGITLWYHASVTFSWNITFHCLMISVLGSVPFFW